MLGDIIEYDFAWMGFIGWSVLLDLVSYISFLQTEMLK